MPSRYHMAVVYKAMMKYGYFEAAQEQLAESKELYSAMLNKMNVDQAPNILQGPSLI